MRHMKRVGLTALLVPSAALGAVLMSAPAQAYPVETGSLSVLSGTLAPGATVTIGGDGYAPGGTIAITVQSAPIEIKTVTGGAQGAFSTTVTLPWSLGVGAHVLQAVGPAAGGGTLVLSRTFTVAADTLPVTGYPIGILSVAGGLVLLSGLATIGLGIRRRMRLSRPSGQLSPSTVFSSGDGR
jgi:hypothetical protein